MKTGGTNVLLLFPDQWRPDWTSANPTLPLQQPNLKQLMTEGTHFTRAVTSSPLCAPSRACFALGLDYNSCPVKSNSQNLPLNANTFYSKLRTAGYHVLACGKMDLAKGAMDWGIDGTHPLPGGGSKVQDWGFTAAIDNSGKDDGYRAAKKQNYCPYTHFLLDHSLLEEHLADFSHRNGVNNYKYTHPTPLPDFAYVDNFEGNQGLGLLQRVPQGESWFLQVNFSSPHNPVDVTESMWTPWQETGFPAPLEGDPTFSAEQHTAARRNYAAMQENIDRWIDIFRKEIVRRGEVDRTVIIFASDHGEMLGDHDHWGKSIPFHASMGIPMVIAGPGFKTGVENSSPVTLLDLAATILDVTGAGEGATFQHGHSLVPIVKGTAPSVRTVAVSGLKEWRAAFDGQWKLIRGFDANATGKHQHGGGKAGDMLFDLESDPNEVTNVIGAHPDIVARLEPYFHKSGGGTDAPDNPPT